MVSYSSVLILNEREIANALIETGGYPPVPLLWLGWTNRSIWLDARSDAQSTLFSVERNKPLLSENENRGLSRNAQSAAFVDGD